MCAGLDGKGWIEVRGEGVDTKNNVLGVGCSLVGKLLA